MNSTLLLIIMSAIFYFCAGVIFFELLAKAPYSTAERLILKALLIFGAPFGLLFICDQSLELFYAVGKIVGVTLFLSIFPFKAFRRFAGERGDALSSDIPFFDLERHKYRTAAIIIAFCWMVFAFFVRRLCV